MADESELAYFYVARSDYAGGIGSSQTVTPAELDDFQEQNNLDGYANVFFADGDTQTSNGTQVWNAFVNNNTAFYYTAGIPMVFKKDMTMGIISGTYEWDQYPLSQIQQYLQK